MPARPVGPRQLVPSPLRAHLTRTGDSKIKYGEDAAKTRAILLGKQAYPCTICGWYHIGGTAPQRSG